LRHHLGRGRPLRQAILAQPFLSELADGTLPADSFRHYILQDSLYLAEYARVLALAAARTNACGTAGIFGRRQGRGAGRGNPASGLLRAIRRYPAMVEQAEATPACLGYTSYLRPSPPRAAMRS
jgi:thiaminase/transcriptional activator TenA